MKILTWNINGIRATSRGKTLKQLLDSLEADIICLQETKVTRDMLNEATAIVDGYTSYFSFSKKRSGYSGVATFCRETVTPVAAEEGLSAALKKDPGIGSYGNLSDFTFDDLDALDGEGRTVITQFSTTSGQSLVVINVYCPRADKNNEERIAFKLNFYKLLQRRAESLVRSGRDVIVLGDINTSHKMIDHCDPCSEEEFSANPSRKWMDNFVKDLNPLSKNISTRYDENTAENNSMCEEIEGMFVDSFRYFHPNEREAFTNWSTVTSARQTNYGTRIDYIFANESLVMDGFTNCVIRPDIEGSDHCPVVATLNITLKSVERPPPFCTKYMPEFCGTQSKLNAYFQPRGSQGVVTTESIKHGDKEVKADSRERNSNNDAAAVAKRPGSMSSFPVAKRKKISSGMSRTKQQSMFSFLNDLSESTKIKTRDLAIDRNMPANEYVTTEAFEQRNDDSESLASSQSSTSSGQVSSSYEDVISKTKLSPSQSSLEESVSSKEDTLNVTEINSLKKEIEENRKEEVAFWKSILKGPRPPPRCPGHNEPSVLRTVKIKGPNQGRKFYCCARPEGRSDNPEARCKFFKWVK